MKRAVKRYKSEEIIILEMSLCKTRSLSLQKEAERIEAEIEVLKRVRSMQSLSPITERCRKLAASLIDNRLQMLKRTHYCLLNSVQVKNMDTVRCKDFRPMGSDNNLVDSVSGPGKTANRQERHAK